MIASLPMYDRPELYAANDQFWALIRDALHDAGQQAPQVLRRGGDAWADWHSPDLLLSQTCGFPYRAQLHGKVTLIGTPDYGVEGCAPGYYRSAIVVRADDPREVFSAFDGAHLAYNDAISQSGWAAFAQEARAAQIAPGLRSATGAHLASMQAVAEGRADIAALDAVSWALMQRYEPLAAKLRVLLLNRPTPGLPLITAAGHDPAPLADAVVQALHALPDNLRDMLCLRGFVQIGAEDYLAQPIPAAP